MRAQCESERQVEELFPASSTTAKVEEVEAGARAGRGGVQVAFLSWAAIPTSRTACIQESHLTMDHNCEESLAHRC